MLSKLRFLLLMPLAALLACGTSSPSTAVAGSGAPTGDWVLVASPGTANASQFSGALTVTGTSATGVFGANSPAICTAGAQTFSAVTGSVVNNVLTLTSPSTSGGVMTATIQLPLITNSIGTQSASGTIQITGGTCVVASSPLVATYIPSFTGTYTGTLSGPVSGTATLTLTESSANASGQFPTTGVLSTFTSTNCSLGTAISTAGLVTGTSVQLAAGNTTITASAGSTASTLNVTFNGAPGCATGTYTGTLTHQ